MRFLLPFLAVVGLSIAWYFSFSIISRLDLLRSQGYKYSSEQLELLQNGAQISYSYNTLFSDELDEAISIYYYPHGNSNKVIRIRRDGVLLFGRYFFPDIQGELFVGFAAILFASVIVIYALREKWWYYIIISLIFFILCGIAHVQWCFGKSLDDYVADKVLRRLGNTYAVDNGFSGSNIVIAKDWQILEPQGEEQFLWMTEGFFVGIKCASKPYKPQMIIGSNFIMVSKLLLCLSVGVCAFGIATEIRSGLRRNRSRTP